MTQCCVGDSLWSSAVYHPLITRSINIYSRDALYGDSMGPSVVEGLITVNTLVGGATPGPFGCQALPHAVTAGLLMVKAGSWSNSQRVLLCPTLRQVCWKTVSPWH